MPAAKVKAKVKSSKRTDVKKSVVKKKILKAKPMVKRSVASVERAVSAPKARGTKPKLHVAPRHETPAKETVFERLLRLKAERNSQFHSQTDKNHSSHDHRMPANHARFSKFAGPRRRAS